MSFFRPKTVESILSTIYKQIDNLEILAEQQEFVVDQLTAKLDEIRDERSVAYATQDRAEKVAAKLRSLVEV